MASAIELALVTRAGGEMNSEDFKARWSSHFAPLLQRAREQFHHDESRIARNLQSGQPLRGLAAALDCVTSGGRLLGYEVAATGSPPDAELLRKVVRYGMWGWACMHARLSREGLSPFDTTGYERGLVWLWCVTRVCEIDGAFQWLSGYVYNSFRQGGMDDGGPQDVEFNNLLWLLSKSIRNGRWAPEAEPDEPLGLYASLVAATDDAAMARSAESVCERMLRARLDGEPNADGEPSIYEYDPWGATPVDLLAFREIRGSLTNEDLSLGHGHPLLEPPFVNFPNLHDFDYKTPLEPVSSAARTLFGEEWRPWPELLDTKSTEVATATGEIRKMTPG